MAEKGSRNAGRIKLSEEALREYLSNLYGCKVEILGIWRLGEEKTEGVRDLKGFGYGIPYVIEFRVKGEVKRVVLETMHPEGFGHDFPSDRAQILLWQHSAFNKLNRHVRSVDVGAFTVDGKKLKSLGDAGEFFILTEFVEGVPYHCDLDRIKDTGSLMDLDEERCLALSDYLVEIHSVKRKDAPQLYVRRLRDLLGHGEGVFGLTDSYPSGLDYVNEKFLVEFEKMCVEWRWRLKKKAHRLSQVHGDFHPWNVLFREGLGFTVLDRSRGEWGEPADDVSAMTINYIFYSLQAYGQMDGPFDRLFLLFWRNYVDKTGDEEILSVIQPFYAWRSLVLASPIWYPNLSANVRKKILQFAQKMLKTKTFDYEDIDSYLK
ncbi:MAG: aminoglycoside phosphotransferase family protein [Candidatus Bathyarchaeia archaeon]